MCSFEIFALPNAKGEQVNASSEVQNQVKEKYGSAARFLSEFNIDADAIAAQVQGKFLSSFIRADKAQVACCQPGCCSPAAAPLKG